MANSIFKRCGCRAPIATDDGTVVKRQLGASCPQLKRADGAWNPAHGTWWFHLEVPDPATGRRGNIRGGGHTTRRDAENVAAKAAELLALAELDEDPDAARVLIADMVRKAIKDKQPLPEPDAMRTRLSAGVAVTCEMTVEQYLTGWLAAKKPVLRPTTYTSYSQQVRQYLIPALGHYRLDRLRAVHVRRAFEKIAEQAEEIAATNAARHSVAEAAKKAWCDHNPAAARAARAKLATMPPFQRPVRAASIQRIRAALRSALTDAVNEQLIAVNVAKLIQLPSGKPPKPKVWTEARVEQWRKTRVVPYPVMVWTAEQTAVFLDRAARHRLFPLFLISAHCGLRRGEVCGLRWADVDLADGVLEVEQQIVQIGYDTAIGATKTEAGARTLMLADPVTAAVRRHKAAQKRQAAEFGDAWIDTGLVFTAVDGSPLHPARITDLFARLAKEAGLPPIRLHDLRHGTATHALTAGVAMKVVSEMLGHSTTAITADLYTSVVDEAKRHAANAIAAQLRG